MGIIVSCVAISVVLNVYSLVAPQIANSQYYYVNKKYNVKLNSYRILDEDGKLSNIVMANKSGDENTVSLINESKKHSNNSILSYSDIGRQFSQNYEILTSNDNDVLVPFGLDYNHKFSINLTDNVFNYDNNRKIVIPLQYKKEGMDGVQYMFFSIDYSSVEIYKIKNFKENDICEYIPKKLSISNLNTVKYMNPDDLKDIDKDVVSNFINEYVLNDADFDLNEKHPNSNFQESLRNIVVPLMINNNNFADALKIDLNSNDINWQLSKGFLKIEYYLINYLSNLEYYTMESNGNLHFNNTDILKLYN
ncbi:hypothetical protein FACS189459_0650 [Bacilli bacterium]|nr:hypothetical protein FACS189459_0650 [Bacilli bacterium]